MNSSATWVLYAFGQTPSLRVREMGLGTRLSVTSSTVIDKTDYSTSNEGKSTNPDTRLNSGGSSLLILYHIISRALYKCILVTDYLSLSDSMLVDLTCWPEKELVDV